MFRHIRQRFTIAVVAALLIIPGLNAFAQLAPQELFVDSAKEATVDVSSDPTIARSRIVDIRADLLTVESNHDVLILNMFEDVELTAVLDRIEENPSGSLTWTGFIDEADKGSVTIVVNPDGVMAGSIILPGGVYKIRYAGAGAHALIEVDESQLPPDAEPIPIYNSGSEENDGGVATEADSGAIIDVLVVYTPAARSAQGGTSAINALVDLAISETNQSYNNSGVTTQLNLVYKGEISYTESSSFSTNLSRLTGTSDGYMDNVHSLRDQYCADAVALIINGTQYCGIANLMTSVSSSFASSAFSVTARTCATGYYSFGHELGHNMGARHDWYVDSNTSPYIYNHGYVYVPGRWRTIMAYNSRCSASGVNCTRIQYWSNPSVTYGGQAMGVGGSTVGSSANNALALSNSRVTFANFRDSTATNCGSTGGGGPTCNGTNYSDTLTGTGDYEYEPNNTYYYSSSSGFHEGDLTGPAGTDFDLYLWKWNGSSWSTVASSTSSSSTESISYSGTSGYYVWRVYSYSGSGEYDLCASRP